MRTQLFLVDLKNTRMDFWFEIGCRYVSVVSKKKKLVTIHENRLRKLHTVFDIDKTNSFVHPQ